MKWLLTVLLFVTAFANSAAKAAPMGDSKNAPKTETELLDKILNCLQYKDSITYTGLFADADTVWQEVLTYKGGPTDSFAMQEMAHLRQNPTAIYQFDPYHNKQIIENFKYVIKKGDDSGLNWSNIILVRYEFQRVRLTRDLQGFEHVAPIRLQGFVFIRDQTTQQTWCVTVTEMQQLRNHWYGGEVKNIIEAASVDEYLVKERKEEHRKQMIALYGLPGDSTETAATSTSTIKKDTAKKTVVTLGGDDDDDNPKKVTKEVVDRRYYTGKFDYDISVKLYVQYLKGSCGEKACSWKAIYKFGDQDEYIKLNVTKTGDKWVFDEDPPLGGMDLELKDKEYKGSWMSTDNQTGYDVYMTRQDLSDKKQAELDGIIENQQWAKPKAKKDKENDDKDIEFMDK